jgi:hypothetical protein
MRAVSRRNALAIGASGAALAFIGWNDRASAAAKEAAEQISKFTSGVAAEKSKVTIELPVVGFGRKSDDRGQLRQ